MSKPQPASEFTARDVLQQIDHRLSLIETYAKTRPKLTISRPDLQTRLRILRLRLRPRSFCRIFCRLHN